MKKIIHTIIILVLIDLLGLGLFWYGYSSMSDLKKHETDIRTQLAEENQKGRKLTTLKQTLATAAKEKERLEHYLIEPSEENQILLISQIEHLSNTALGTHIETSSFDFRDGKPPVLHGEFALSGSWQSLYHLLRLIETYPSRVAISRYDINFESQGSIKIDQWKGSIAVDFSGLKKRQP